ncbi:MAG: methylated-DNA--[protein]-cysteine S-methyltransferase, partial [Candidatus Aminicenantes bacterium]|nr:methylated-DNA--[protein]-cysteine S-methyltransferase [Candidatus Aminicenantes bacterium]
YDSKVGILEIEGTEKAITKVNFSDKKKIKSDSNLPPILKKCLKQLDEYFRGKRQNFSLELQLEGTDFQKKVWEQLQRIPYGETASYKDVAVAIGNEKAVRAVGGANGMNNIAIIIPCHRVIGADGNLVGFGGGLWRKVWLLNHEKQ